MESLGAVERPDLPLFIVAEVALQRPYTHDDLSRAFSDFACSTDVAISEALGKTTDPEEVGELVGFGDRIARLQS